MCVCFFWLCSPSPGDSGCFLTGWPPYLLSGHDLQVGSAWFLSCLKSRVEFFRSSHTSDYLFLFLTVWSAYLGRPPRMLHRRGSRFNKKRGWKGEKNKHRLIRVDKSSPVSFCFFPSVSPDSPIRQVKWLQNQEVMLQDSWKRVGMCVRMCVCDMRGFLEIMKDDTRGKVEEMHRRHGGKRGVVHPDWRTSLH